jgi:Flp pilus assembly protein TadD
LDQATAERPDLILALEERGESLWQLDRKHEAVAVWSDAVKQNAGLVLANYQLAGAAASLGEPEAAAAYEKQGDQYTPADPLFHWMIGLRLQNVGMNALAEKHFQLAMQLDPKFRTGGMGRKYVAPTKP